MKRGIVLLLLIFDYPHSRRRLKFCMTLLVVIFHVVSSSRCVILGLTVALLEQ